MSVLTATDFARGFVASLVCQGADAIQPKSPSDRQGFRRVLETLDQEIARLREKGGSAGEQRALYRALVTLKAQFSPSNSGTYDSFEAALRNLQMSLTACPNPFYEDIEFTVSDAFANSILGEFPDKEREVISAAAAAFLKAKRPR